MDEGLDIVSSVGGDVQAANKNAINKTTTPVSAACLVTCLQTYRWTRTVQPVLPKSLSPENEPGA